MSRQPISDLPRATLLRAELSRVDGADPGETGTAPIAKHRRMPENPFRFLRGSAQLFYADLKNGRLEPPPALSEGPPLTTLTGDCHLSNFGFLTEQGSHGDQVVFCPNDYDDASVGPAVWDLARFLVSLPLAVDYTRELLERIYAANESDSLASLRAPSLDAIEKAGQAFLKAYRKAFQRVMCDPEYRLAALDQIPKRHVLHKAFRKACRRAAGGRDFTTKSTLAKEVKLREGRCAFVSVPSASRDWSPSVRRP